jgi:hypothetical protein
VEKLDEVMQEMERLDKEMGSLERVGMGLRQLFRRIPHILGGALAALAGYEFGSYSVSLAQTRLADLTLANLMLVLLCAVLALACFGLGLTLAFSRAHSRWDLLQEKALKNVDSRHAPTARARNR